MSKTKNAPEKISQEGRERLEQLQKKTVDGIWVAIFLLGMLLLLVVLMHWSRTN